MGTPGSPATLVMGVLNVTPDSFSDGGRFEATDAAISHAHRLVSRGADIVDIGGESTRPGAERVDPAEEMERVLPVIRALAQEGVVVSIDTMRAATAEASVAAGASIVNDVSGGLADPRMAAVVAAADVDFVVMHWRAHSATMDAHDQYVDVVREVRDELAARVDALTAAGVRDERIILDPGLGFAKVADTNWPLLATMAEWSGGRRVLIGASRKRFLGTVIARPGVDAGDPARRDHATTAVTALAAQAGAWAVRVHDARASSDAVRVVSAWQNALDTTR
ncbi:dihydropteroate synthase [Demequina aurantiaca]|uniref:dihydropteroate synthase n=1 Tax=Demequina aurantiaca TaxID=676200 RepID=UPI000A68F513|nr:dihydropteroate synthase [Demequina aurantiaca]